MEANMKSNNRYQHLLAQANLVNLHIKQMFDYYRQCFLREPKWLEVLTQSTCIPDKLKHSPIVGVCDRTFGTHLPKARILDGGALRGCLMRVGLVLPSGGEYFRGCLVFPKMKEGLIVSAIGYRYANRVRIWQKQTLIWQKPAEDEFIDIGMYAMRGMIDE